MSKQPSLWLLLLITGAVFFPSWNAQLVWDDQLLVGLAPWRNVEGLSQIWSQDLWADIPGEHSHSWYRPLMALSIIFNALVFGDRVFFHHLHSWLWQLLCIGLLWMWLSRWTENRAAVALATAVFALHPAQAELFRFVAARNDILCTTALLGFALSLNRSDRRFVLLTGICALMALLSKESAFIALPLLLILDSLRIWKPPQMLQTLPLITAMIIAGGMLVPIVLGPIWTVMFMLRGWS